MDWAAIVYNVKILKLLDCGSVSFGQDRAEH